MDGSTAINFTKYVKIVLSKMAFALHDGICWSFKKKKEFVHPHCMACDLYTTTQNLGQIVLTCFTKMIAEQPSLTQYERPM